jgi:competence protein ComEC
MLPGTIAFMVGVLLLQQQSELPPTTLLLSTPLPVLIGWRFRRLLPLACLCLGYLWALANAHWSLDSSIDPNLVGKELLTEGVVLDLPETDDQRSRFLYRIEKIANADPVPLPDRVRIAWYGNPQELRAGDRWQFRIRLKAPHGMRNPGSFDYEGWLFSQGIRATGHVRRSADNLLLERGPWNRPLQTLREWLDGKIRQAVSDPVGEGLIRALVIGERSGIGQSQWEVFRRTGSNHLVAISGLHVGIVSGLFFFMGRLLWRRSAGLCLWLPAPRAAALIALAAAAGYAAISGFAVPSQRALIMLFVLLGGIILGRTVRPAGGIALALLLVLLFDSMAVLSPGFWLSFGAVAVIMAGTWGRPGIRNLSPWKTLLYVQLLVSLGLAPLLLILGLDVSLAAPLVNLVAVPLFTLLLVPAALLGTLLTVTLPALGAPLLDALGWCLGQGYVLFSQVAAVSPMIPAPAGASWWAVLSAVAGILLMLAPSGFPVRKLAPVFLLPLFLQPAGQLQEGEFRLTMLDVGQGLSVVVHTREHLLVYDAGPVFFSGFDTAEAVLVPYLKWRGVSFVDRVILSNGDLDHSGGFRTLQDHYPIGDVFSGEPERLADVGVKACVAGTRWRWDGVEFRILHPNGEPGQSGNNASCVLIIKGPASRVLLTGDIEKEAEAQLVRDNQTELMADVVQIPHHGSNTSSTAAFVSATRARWALASVGFENRYGFPKQQVVGRWQKEGAQVLDTAALGAMELLFSRDGAIQGPVGYREISRRYWSPK